MVKVGVLGSGRLAGIIAHALADGAVPKCELVGILGRTYEHTAALADTCNCTACATLEELLELKPEYILEAATAEALKSWAIPILCASCNVICLSVGALIDDVFRHNIETAAEKHRSKLYVAPGVIGGLDFASAACLAGSATACLSKYHYGSVNGRTSIFPEHFDGTCREAYAACPRHLNIAVTAGLACGGVDQTKMKIETIPENQFFGTKLEIDGDFGHAVVEWHMTEKVTKTGAALAAWSALSTLQRATSPIFI